MKKFTTKVYINKNTKHLREELEKLGYDVSEIMNYQPGLATLPSLSKVIGLESESILDLSPDYIKTGDESLFLALASLREDTDRYQWFTDGEDVWEKSDSDLPSKYIQLNGHKATVDELLKFFGN